MAEMSDDTKDPREAVLTRAWRTAMKRYGFAMNEANMEAVRALARDAYDAGVNAARIDRADPLRAMLPEVVAAMEYALPSLDYDTDRLLKGDYYGAGIKALAKLDEFRYLLSKLRKLTPTKGEKDDE